MGGKYDRLIGRRVISLKHYDLDGGYKVPVGSTGTITGVIEHEWGGYDVYIDWDLPALWPTPTAHWGQVGNGSNNIQLVERPCSECGHPCGADDYLCRQCRLDIDKLA